MNKLIFKCIHCQTIMSIWGPHPIPKSFMPSCPACSVKMLNMASDEYAYGPKSSQWD